MKFLRKMAAVGCGALACVSMAFGLAGCEEQYTAKQTDALLLALETTVGENKAELDGKITALTTATQEKDNELSAKIIANESAISALKAAYESKVAELEKVGEDNAKAIANLTAEYTAKVEALVKADGDNAKAIADLKTEYENKVSALKKADEDNAKAIADLTAKYTAKVAGLESEIAQAKEDIKANKEALEKAVADLKAEYEEKVAELEDFIEALEATDKTQNEKIKELVEKIADLQAENDKLEGELEDYITSQHVHSFGEWVSFTEGENIPCEERIFYHVCKTCDEIVWKHGTADDHDWAVETVAPTCQAQGYDEKTCEICGKVEKENYTDIVDHKWAETYSHDNSYHWYGCETCDEAKGKEEHTVENSGECSVCKELVGGTEGVLYEVVDGKARVLGYEGTATRVRIAESYEGAPVAEILGSAFYDCSRLTSVVIPDSVTSIGEEAFFYCCSLTKIVIPDSVTSIGDGAFNSCYGLTSVVLPDSVTSIGGYAFVYCSSLTSIKIPDGVESIGSGAFYYCRRLKFNEYGNAKYLGNENNPYLALIEVKNKNYSSYNIYESTKVIADYAFYECSSLTSVYYKGSAKDWAKITIGDYNDKLKKGTRYYYTESEPALNAEGTAYDGNYWHYDTDGVTPVIWVYTKEE